MVSIGVGRVTTVIIIIIILLKLLAFKSLGTRAQKHNSKLDSVPTMNT